MTFQGDKSVEGRRKRLIEYVTDPQKHSDYVHAEKGPAKKRIRLEEENNTHTPAEVT